MNTARLTILFIFLALFSKAQEGKYVKLTKGQLNPFDTAVAVEIDQYRKETLKLQLADALIHSQDSLTEQLILRSSVCDSLVSSKNANISFLMDRLARKQDLWEESEADLSQSLMRIEILERQRRSIFRKPWVWLAIGAGAGIIRWR